MAQDATLSGDFTVSIGDRGGEVLFKTGDTAPNQPKILLKRSNEEHMQFKGPEAGGMFNGHCERPEG
jgi:hypothetical protein